MSWLQAMLALLGLYAAAVLALVAAGRRCDARALAGFVPDCVVLVRRLLHDSRVPRSRKFVLGLVAGYLLCPVDLVPDFIPVAGQLDDAIVLALALRSLTRSGGAALLREHWPGPGSSLAAVSRAIGAP
jgi:uncharacterized membrane protein YkvA (DUF1232 family)